MERTTGALTWDQQYAERRGLRFWPAEELIRFLGRRRSDSTLPLGSKVLEIGCGNGANLWGIASEGYLTTGIDFSPQAVALARSRIGDLKLTAHVEEASILEWPTWIRDQDAIVDVVTLQHVPLSAHDRVFHNIHNSLRPGGVFFSYHLGSRTWDFGKGALVEPYTFDNISDPNAIFPNNGLVCMPPAGELLSRLSSAGFDVDRAETVVKTYDGDATKFAEYHVIEATRQ